MYYWKFGLYRSWNCAHAETNRCQPTVRLWVHVVFQLLETHASECIYKDDDSLDDPPPLHGSNQTGGYARQRQRQLLARLNGDNWFGSRTRAAVKVRGVAIKCIDANGQLGLGVKAGKLGAQRHVYMFTRYFIFYGFNVCVSFMDCEIA